MEYNFKSVKTKLEKNISLIKKELQYIEEAENKLLEEKDGVVHDIEDRAECIKKEIDNVVRQMIEDVQKVFENNTEEIKRNRSNLTKKLSDCRNNIDRCDRILGGKGTSSKDTLVSERKVAQMVYDAIDHAHFIKPVIRISRRRYAKGGSLDEATWARQMMGEIEITEETLDRFEEVNSSFLDEITHVKSLTSSYEEINTMYAREGSNDVYVCFHTSKELARFDDSGVKTQTLKVDFKVDDIAIAPDGTVFATVPDGSSIKRITEDAKRKIVCSDIFTCDLYIHGLSISFDKKRILACATDKPNYSNVAPRETTIIDYTFETQNVKRIPIKRFSGKVYRITQNINEDYILTFPKEGLLLCLRRSGDIRHRFTKLPQTPKDSPKDANPTFWPSGVCCDRWGHVYVSDWLGKTIMVLDMNFRALGKVGGGYKGPNALAVNWDSDTLWIGDKGSIHVWKLD